MVSKFSFKKFMSVIRNIFTKGIAMLPSYRPILQISLPHPESNIRFLQLVKGDHKDKQWIQFRQNQILKHHTFWKNKNLYFEQEKQAFIQKFGENGTVSPERLSLFYREYSEKTRDDMFEYNKHVWISSIRALKPGFQYEIHLAKKVISNVSQNFKDKIRLYIIAWFAAGLTTPLLLQ
jgi:hypothetical protein